ncbi:GPI mannosyltransferase 1, putative [Plasmodium yoelii]|uniref:GPI mannosyltransferase 1 n=1 Tax=Plasmodium yoelii TaxID=5861 RepID=A0A077Y2A6_PLAYE|nr:GPI mannosyltransferase 1, putative [Plasmodium yoelii]CDU16972.1 GPI mannosyltransferase I, putative, fragment [Plasmodium yoelii]VTZ75318.1 GPI mannosyltransferase 1, putative [Plasmodium yoelii]|eukprot:XP_022813159.1 GPI mannosyltransferase 1, putative [Plasmodium yoelii]
MGNSITEKRSKIFKQNKSYFSDINNIDYTKKIIYFLGILVRIITYYYGLWQDKNLNVKFTDIDYYVFSDAAKYVLNNKSPYNRYTYRYTPLLAYLMIPNFIINFSFGKFLFSSIDFLVSIIIIKIIKIKYPENKNYILYASLWLLNPLVITISIRGNADCIPCLLVLLTVFFIYQKKIYVSAFFYGLSVNFKIYPIIYSLPLMLYLNKNYLNKDNIFQLKQIKTEGIYINKIISIFYIIRNFFKELFKLNTDQLKFSLFSFTTFLALNLIFYAIYGYEFLYESFIYHLVRQDHKHNFSLFFYIMYLTIENNSKIIPLITFIPQFVLVALFGFKYAKSNLELSMFLQTLSFIALNKVITSQYFIWCTPFLPIILNSITLNRTNLILIFCAVLFFVIAKAHWLFWAYYLEFKGYNTFIQIFYSSILFVISEMSVCWIFMYMSFKEENKKNVLKE